MNKARSCNCDQSLDYQRVLQWILSKGKEKHTLLPARLLQRVERALGRWNPVMSVVVERTIPAHIEKVMVDIKMGEVFSMVDEDGRPFNKFPQDVVDQALKQLEEEQRDG